MLILKRPGDSREFRCKTVSATLVRRLSQKGHTYHTIAFRSLSFDKDNGGPTFRRFELPWLVVVILRLRVYCLLFRIR
jgi:hypothetical protein